MLPNTILMRALSSDRTYPSKLHLILQAIESAGRIRRIAYLAFHRGIRVRWFDNSAKPKEVSSWLEPLNADHVVTIRKAVPVDKSDEARLFFAYLSLSVANKESLVFWSYPVDKHLGVLFSADNDLAGVGIPKVERAIVTAPHHGSESNSAAYPHVTSAIKRPIWVRSDGRSSKNPCTAYLNQQVRYCTLCRGNLRPKKEVCLHIFSCGRIEKGKGTLPCCCM